MITVATFAANNDLQAVNHQDSPRQGAGWTDPRPGAPAPPAPKSQQLRSVQFGNSFTAWFAIQNINWNAFDPNSSFLFLRHFNWRMQLNVTVDTSRPVGSRATPAQRAPQNDPVGTGQGPNTPVLTAPVANTSNTTTVSVAPTLP